jgi:predicted phosphoribosyltransferase
VEVGYQVARYLHMPLSLIIVRKLPLPDNPEAGFGALAEDGSLYLHKRVFDGLYSNVMNSILSEQKKEVERRRKVLRREKPLPEIAGKTVILVDDGIAMGSTMQAAIILCKNKNAQKIVVAAPVASLTAAVEIALKADETIILEKSAHFRAVAQFYRDWQDVSDEQVVKILSTKEQNKDG